MGATDDLSLCPGSGGGDAMARLVLFLFGPMRVILDGRPVTEFESHKVMALLAYLALEAGLPHSRESLAGLLWPEQPETHARGSLRQALFNLRRSLRDHETQPSFLHVSRDTIQFNCNSDCWLDTRAFDDLIGAKLCGRPGKLNIKHVPGFEHDVKRRVPDVAKARDLLGFEARIEPEEGMNDVVEWLRRQMT